MADRQKPELRSAHAQLVTQIRESLPPLFDLVTPMPYVELQKILDEAVHLGRVDDARAAAGESLSVAYTQPLRPSS